jgi:hypothetical protein
MSQLRKPKTIRPIDPATINQDPYIDVRSAAKLTGLGEKLIRKLPLRRFGVTDYIAVQVINDFIGIKEDRQIESTTAHANT